MRGQQDHQSRLFCELSALLFNLLRSPLLPPDSPPRRSPPPPQITPAGFASLLLGISVALMLCGSVTFFIGFVLMPWVLGLVTLLYVAGVVSSLSVLGRSILCYAAPRKDLPHSCKVNTWNKMIARVNGARHHPKTLTSLGKDSVLNLIQIIQYCA
ncbi:hypothetical protein Fmac_004760 [Flemingia macrophylla]|uniref:Uncharacterized protein n=1 Tax=Flemingia macrophylla TaxID=520843 RepID=A0ABD1N8I4_9FABA